MKSPLERFQSLLRELFQFDCQDLDFGIYRVLNFKRREIEDFITTRLPQRVDAAFARYAEADQAAAERELELKRQQILATLKREAFNEAVSCQKDVQFVTPQFNFCSWLH